MDSRQKSRLLRQMTRDLSIASSTGSNHGTISTDSTSSSFNPEKDEAAMSTRQLDHNYSQKLPELRTTAKKCGRWAPRQQTQSIVLNTSAIGRAFPNFSQGGSSDDSMSLEVGRVAPPKTSTSQLHAHIKDDDRIGSFKENERPKNTRFTRTAYVTDDNTNDSFTGYERPNTTRFTRTANVSEKLRTPSGTPSKSPKKQNASHTSHSSNAQPTQQSFIIPNTHESSHVISASFNKNTGIPFPGDEKDIYTNIDLLKDKVSDLETQLARTLSLNDQLGREVHDLRRDLSFTLAERAKAEVERDQAVSQLAESFKRNETLAHENRQLKQHQASTQSERITIRTERDQAVHQLSESFKRTEELEVEIQHLKHQRSESLVEIKGLKQQRSESLTEIEGLKHERSKSLKEIENLEVEAEERRRFVEEMTQDTTNSLQDSSSQILKRNKAIKKLKQATDQLLAGNEPLGTDRFDISADTSYASILGPGYLRNVQSLAQNERPKSAPHPPVQDTSFAATISHRSQNEQPKSATRQPAQDTFATSHRTQNERPKSAIRQPAQDTSFATVTSHRRHKTDDMTSAYIIPDISHPSLSTSARQVFDGLCKHECANCTICTRVASFETKHHTQSKVTIPKPVPVSKRMPEPTPYEDEPTLRPSVKPSIAIATVIKGLEDELTHLKEEHERITAVYTKHDASLGMRQRKALKKRLDELLFAIEQKSDQIYGLYDVVEGQAGEEEDTELDLPWEGIED